MTIDQRCTLIQAGYTKEEIQAMETNSPANPPANPPADPNTDEQEENNGPTAQDVINNILE